MSNQRNRDAKRSKNQKKKHAKHKSKLNKRVTKNTTHEPKLKKKRSATSTPEQNVLHASAELHLMSAKELSKLKAEKRHRHWGRRITSKNAGMVCGERGGGKTFCVMGLAVAMACGVEFLGQKPGHARNVVMLDGEMGFGPLHERLKTVCASLNVKPPKNLLLMTPDMFTTALPSLGTEAGQQKIDAVIPDDTDVIIVDNVSSWNRGGKEDAEGWSPWNNWLLKHKHKGRTIIVVHHTGKDGTQRGTSRREDNLDFSIVLKPRPNPEHPGSLSFTLEWTKCRHLRKDEVRPVHVTLVADEKGIPRWEHKIIATDDEKRATAEKLQAEGKTLAEIGVVFGVDKGTVSRWLKK